MIWNTIAHPKMMTGQDTGGFVPADGPTLPDKNESTIEGIKYADPHKLAFFDLLVDASDRNNPKLIHGDFETVKNKILNHELVVGGEIAYDTSPDKNTPEVAITIGSIIKYVENLNKICLKIFWSNGQSIVYIVSSDNAVSSNGGAPINPGDH